MMDGEPFCSSDHGLYHFFFNCKQDSNYREEVTTMGFGDAKKKPADAPEGGEKKAMPASANALLKLVDFDMAEDGETAVLTAEVKFFLFGKSLEEFQALPQFDKGLEVFSYISVQESKAGNMYLSARKPMIPKKKDKE
jgi:hypothetical protein